MADDEASIRIPIITLLNSIQTAIAELRHDVADGNKSLDAKLTNELVAHAHKISLIEQQFNEHRLSDGHAVVTKLATELEAIKEQVKNQKTLEQAQEKRREHWIALVGTITGILLVAAGFLAVVMPLINHH